MFKDPKVMTPSVAGTSELVVLAPIIKGFVPGLDAVTYKTRAKLLLKLLHSGRKSAHEFNLFRVVSDAVERVGVIHTVRVTVLEPEDKIMLSVNFDGAYEAYVRVIWQKAARLLDLIFCNTEEHVAGWTHSYADWSGWLRRRQVEIPFYYGKPGFTQPDATYLQMLERYERRDANADLNATRIAAPLAEDIAWTLVRDSIDPQCKPYAVKESTSVPPGTREAVRQGLQGLAGIYRIADLYPPGSADGEVLHSAARELLPELERMLRLPLEYGQAIAVSGGTRLRDALNWFAADHPLPTARAKIPLTEDPAPPLDVDAQGGILRAYEGAITHGCVCLVSCDDAQALAALIKAVPVTQQGRDPAAGEPRWNLALTFDGLRACGVPESLLDRLPVEFRQGMAQRAGLLGDLHGNHPRRWQLPRLNWPQALDHPDDTDPKAPVVALESVHVMVQVRLGPKDCDASGTDLRPRIAELLKNVMGAAAGIRPLSVQWLTRLFADGGVVDHFGFRDSLSDPEFGRKDTWFYPNQVHLGEALLGHPNAADQASVFDAQLDPLLRNGSFLVVRKLRQDRHAFNKAVERAAGESGLCPELVKGKMVGRMAKSGAPLVDLSVGAGNDFNYEQDPQGTRCPMHAHIRRANPREIEVTNAASVQPLPGGRPPRLFRRGMSYVAPAKGHDQGDYGLLFMAYNSSIGEQFEVIQRWLSGGNSSHGYSGSSDPLLGVPVAGQSRWFRFEHDQQTVRMQLDGSDELGGDPKPLVRLEWGAYLFAPSIPGLAHLAGLAAQIQKAKVDKPAWDVEDGVRRIAALQDIEAQGDRNAAVRAWKEALEDPDGVAEFSSASIWAAIRQRHGGVLRIPYGVLVADAGLVRDVLGDGAQRYTVDGYQQRLQASIGPIYLGLDDGPAYQRQSKACNDAIMALTFNDGFTVARKAAQDALNSFVKDASMLAMAQKEQRWELNLEVREIVEQVLATVIEEWFGLNETGSYLKRGGFSWAWRAEGPGRYPGQFYAPSRYTFQPLPGEAVAEVARRHGSHLRVRMNEFLAAHHETIKGPISRVVLQAQGTSPDFDLAARTIVGAIMGFVPTTDGSLRRIVAEWLRDGTLWQLRARIAAGSLNDSGNAGHALHEPIRRAMLLRPVPELVWRTSRSAHALGRTGGLPAEPIAEGDVLILAQVSATHQGLETNSNDLTPIFGGVRTGPKAATHGCPGYLAAMGLITGVLSAIVDAPYRLRPGTVASALSFEGDPQETTPAPAPAQGSAADAGWKPLTAPQGFDALEYGGWRKDTFARVFGLTGGAAPQTPAPAPLKKLAGWGDSWFTLTHPLTDKEWDLHWALAELRYDTSSFITHSRSGLTLAEMARVPRRTEFYSMVRAQKPDAVLIDGGGNDVHAIDANGKKPLQELLRGGSPANPFGPGAIQSFVHELLAGQLKTVLNNLVEATGGRTPVFVLGYDHPLPDGAKFPVFPGPWLQPVISGIYHYDFTQGCAIMKTLIDELNTMMQTVVGSFAGQNVHHVDLRGTLAALPGYDIPSEGYRRYWLNELHPTIEGHRALAGVVHARIAAVLRAAAVPAAPH